MKLLLSLAHYIHNLDSHTAISTLKLDIRDLFISSAVYLRLPSCHFLVKMGDIIM
jgi:hypothetical protein